VTCCTILAKRGLRCQLFLLKAAARLS